MQALDYSRSSSSNTISSRLRRVDLSHNNIDSLGDLRPHSNLLELNLSSNRLLQTGSSLQPLNKLRRLDLSNNNMSSCHGLQGACAQSAVRLFSYLSLLGILPLVGCHVRPHCLHSHVCM